MIDGIGMNEEMELHLDDFLERDEAGLPALLHLEVPFRVQIRVNGRPEDVDVDSLTFRRPPSEALDVLGRLAADQSNVFRHMREFVSRVARVPEHGEVGLTEQMLAKRLDSMDFYRAWECASAFLPKPKKSAAPA